MGAATGDVAVETADIALMNDDLKEEGGRGHRSWPQRAVHTVKQDILVFAVFLNALGVLLAGTGVVHPVGAAILHNIGSIAVVLNSARLIFRQRLWGEEGDMWPTGERSRNP
jgi:cation transport ATPase